MTGQDGFRGAIAAVGARLSGDSEGENAILGDCDGCRPLLAGLLTIAEKSLGAIAEHDHVAPDAMAEALARWLRNGLQGNPWTPGEGSGNG